MSINNLIYTSLYGNGFLHDSTHYWIHHTDPFGISDCLSELVKSIFAPFVPYSYRSSFPVFYFNQSIETSLSVGANTLKVETYGDFFPHFSQWIESLNAREPSYESSEIEVAHLILQEASATFQQIQTFLGKLLKTKNCLNKRTQTFEVCEAHKILDYLLERTQKISIPAKLTEQSVAIYKSHVEEELSQMDQIFSFEVAPLFVEEHNNTIQKTSLQANTALQVAPNTFNSNSFDNQVAPNTFNSNSFDNQVAPNTFNSNSFENQVTSNQSISTSTKENEKILDKIEETKKNWGLFFEETCKTFKSFEKQFSPLNDHLLSVAAQISLKADSSVSVWRDEAEKFVETVKTLIGYIKNSQDEDGFKGCFSLIKAMLQEFKEAPEFSELNILNSFDIAYLKEKSSKLANKYFINLCEALEALVIADSMSNTRMLAEITSKIEFFEKANYKTISEIYSQYKNQLNELDSKHSPSQNLALAESYEKSWNKTYEKYRSQIKSFDVLAQALEKCTETCHAIDNKIAKLNEDCQFIQADNLKKLIDEASEYLLKVEKEILKERLNSKQVKSYISSISRYANFIPDSTVEDTLEDVMAYCEKRQDPQVDLVRKKILSTHVSKLNEAKFGLEELSKKHASIEANKLLLEIENLAKEAVIPSFFSLNQEKIPLNDLNASQMKAYSNQVENSLNKYKKLSEEISKSVFY